MSPCFNDPEPAEKFLDTNATPYGFTSPFAGTVETVLTGLGKNASSGPDHWARLIPGAQAKPTTTISEFHQLVTGRL
jgi:hypothetical protein